MTDKMGLSLRRARCDSQGLYPFCRSIVSPATLFPFSHD